MSLLNTAFHIIEVLAAIAGTYFISKNKGDSSIRYFVYYLWITVFVETIGILPRLIISWESLSFLKDSIWAHNFWIYNIYLVLTFWVYVNYFKSIIKRGVFKNIINVFVLVFVTSSFVNFVVTDVFFNGLSSFSFILGSISLLFSALLYFYEVLQTDIILNFYKSISFYIAIGSLVFYLSITPLFIYNEYYSSNSPEFVKIYNIIRELAIIFMYSCYTFGFIVCLKKKKSY